jgi:hypothetical protein
MQDGGSGEGTGTGEVEQGSGSKRGKKGNASIVKTPRGDSSLSKPTQFTSTLEFAISQLPGRKRAFMEFAKLVDDDKGIQNFVAKWESLTPTERRRTTLTDICESLDLNAKDVLKAVVGVAYEMNSDISNLIAAVMHPQVTKATVKFALKEGGRHDREMLHTHANFIPQKGGMNVNLSANANANSAAAAKNTVQGDESGLPDFEESSIETIRVIRGDQ